VRTVSLSLLDQVSIASPCSVRWEDMPGDERVRSCDQCNLKVHNIAEMTRDEAEAFLREAVDIKARGGRVCGLLWRRADGTILTKDCPVGLAAVRASVMRRVSRAAAVLGLVFSAVITLGRGRAEGSRLREMEPFSGIARVLNPVAPFLGPMARPTRYLSAPGEICLPLPVQPAPPARGQGTD
jgi:hypothetical protein